MIMKIKTHKKSAAFTLIETMMAVLILSMAIAAMHSTWMAILGATKSGARAAAQIQRERVALGTMELALNCSVIYFNETRQNQGLTNFYSFVVDDFDTYKTLSFVARLPEDFLGSSHFPHQPIRRVTLQVEPTRSGRNDLVMRQWQMTKTERAMEDGDDGLAITLARDVDLFEVKFWSSIVEDYVEYWDEPEVLPKRIRIYLALRDEESEEAVAEALSMREFALVSDVISEEMISPDPPLERPRSAITSPTNAVCNEPSPSMTSTPPLPGSDSTDLRRALSSKQRTVVIGPANCGRPPYWNICRSQLRTSGPMSSTRSAVGRGCGRGVDVTATVFQSSPPRRATHNTTTTANRPVINAAAIGFTGESSRSG